jgi:hypothetical protein
MNSVPWGTGGSRSESLPRLIHCWVELQYFFWFLEPITDRPERYGNRSKPLFAWAPEWNETHGRTLLIVGVRQGQRTAQPSVMEMTRVPQPRTKDKPVGTILIIVILILLFGGGGGYYAHGRYGGRGLGGILGLVLVILIILWLVGGLHGFGSGAI